MLSDIGLTQGDVRSALSGGITEDPTDQLGARYGERRYATRATARETRHGNLTPNEFPERLVPWGLRQPGPPFEAGHFFRRQ